MNYSLWSASWCLHASERRRALLDECGHAFALVFSPERLLKEPQLGIQTGTGVTIERDLHERFGRRHGARALIGDRRCELARLGHQLFQRMDRVDEADSERLVRLHAPPG